MLHHHVEGAAASATVAPVQLPLKDSTSIMDVLADLDFVGSILDMHGTSIKQHSNPRIQQDLDQRSMIREHLKKLRSLLF